MSCFVCGAICRCSANAQSSASPRWLAEAEKFEIDETSISGKQEPIKESPAKPGAPEFREREKSQASATENPTAWRQEVASRLNRYQSRRKPRPPRYPSLHLRFEDEGYCRPAKGISVEPVSIPQTTHDALALDEFADKIDLAREMPETGLPVPPATQASHQNGALTSPIDTSQPDDATLPSPITSPTAKIIEFPRSWTPTPAPLDELAEPVMSRPRILEAPEVVPPPPALGGITIEPAQQSEMEKRPGIDFPLQGAPLGRRILSAAIDDVIIAVACFIFGFVFWKMTALSPPPFQIMGIAVGMAGLCWAAYQYLLLVYSGTTPGLRLARLELARFDGSPASRRLRRWRVLASFLSAASLGMGYAWVFLDEDALCWHDRITHTYLAPRNSKSTTLPTTV